jgi:hypothetical protein
VRLEVLDQLKNPMSSSRIEAAVFRLVAQCLNQLRYRVPQADKMLVINVVEERVATIYLENGGRMFPQKLYNTQSTILHGIRWAGTGKLLLDLASTVILSFNSRQNF